VIADATDLAGLLSRPGAEVDVAVVDVQRSPGLATDAVVLARTHIRGPVVALTIDAREGSIIAPLAAGATSIALRSSSAAAIRKAVAAVHEGGIYIDPTVGSTLVELVTLIGKRPARSSLTRTELRVLHRFPLGMTNAQIGAEMGVSANTIKTHVRSILAKLDRSVKREAVQVARARGLVE
jgi:NarL family two-component system response regulator LiaR